MADLKVSQKIDALVKKGGGESAEKYSVADFLEIIRILRSPDGCPWDKEQTHKSLTSNLIEESYEAVEAISAADSSGLCEELGDVLLQIMLHSVIAEEDGSFTFDEVVDTVSRKMIVRHPHVFSDVKANSAEEVLQNWDAIKRASGGGLSDAGEIANSGGSGDLEIDEKSPKRENGQQKLLRDVPRTLPALMRAAKVQGRARNVGFDFENVPDVFNVIESEIEEVKEAVRLGDKAQIEEELGDVLFSVVNLSRFLNVDSEISLNQSTDKFIERFSALENLAFERNISIQDSSMEQLDELWNDVKKRKYIES